MEILSLVVGIVSLVVGVISIILGIASIAIAKRESKQSTENYHKTRELLKKIENKSEMIDRAIQIQQTQLVNIINKALDKVGQPPIEMSFSTNEDIDSLFNDSSSSQEKSVYEEWIGSWD